MTSKITGPTYGSKDIADRYGVSQGTIWQLVYTNELKPCFRTVGRNGRKGHSRWTEAGLSRVERVLRRHGFIRSDTPEPQQVLPLPAPVVVESKTDSTYAANGVDPVASTPILHPPVNDPLREQIRLIVREELLDSVQSCLIGIEHALSRSIDKLKTGE